MPWHFGPFRLDPANATLRQGEHSVFLRPKAFDILAYLVTHAGQLVTKEALLDAVWPETAVGEGVLKTSMNEVRKALGETAKAPQWIATVHRRGYRFLAPVTMVESGPPAAVPIARTAPQPVLFPAPGPPAPPLVAREAEVATLHQWYAKVLQGERHLGFITGEAGLGKTTLVDAFVAQLAAQESLWLGHGQCIEQYGAGEAYLPLLEALGQMGRTPDGSHLVALLRHQAPSWLLQLPALLPPAEYAELQQSAGGSTRERMLRELAEAMEVLTAARPCVLVFEDLHWSDTATIEWLAYIARRRGLARLLVLGTYRPVEAIVRAHPVHAMVLELTQAQAFAFWGAGGQILQGWSVVVQGGPVAALTAMRQGIAALQALGARIERPVFLAMLTEGYGVAATPTAGLEVLAEALAMVEETGERCWEAELHRLCGELLLQAGSTAPQTLCQALPAPFAPQPEACFQHALAIARQQQAKSLELRAAMSLARLWQQQGKRAAAQTLLAEVYGWFTEGFDTLDLQEAHALLASLA